MRCANEGNGLEGKRCCLLKRCSLVYFQVCFYEMPAESSTTAAFAFSPLRDSEFITINFSVEIDRGKILHRRAC